MKWFGDGWRGDWDNPDPRDKDYWIQIEESLSEKITFCRALLTSNTGSGCLYYFESGIKLGNVDLSSGYINSLFALIDSLCKGETDYYAYRVYKADKANAEAFNTYYTKVFNNDMNSLTDSEDIFWTLPQLFEAYTGDIFEWYGGKYLFTTDTFDLLQKILKFLKWACDQLTTFSIDVLSNNGYSKKYNYGGSSNQVDGAEMPVSNSSSSSFIGLYGADTTSIVDGVICFLNGFGGSTTFPSSILNEEGFPHCTSDVYTDSYKTKSKNGWNLSQLCYYYQHTHYPTTLCGKIPGQTYTDSESNISIGIAKGIYTNQNIEGHRQIEKVSPGAVYAITACNCRWEDWGYYDEEGNWISNNQYVCYPDYDYDNPTYPVVSYYSMGATFYSNRISVKSLVPATYKAFYALSSATGESTISEDYGPDENGNSAFYKDVYEGHSIAKRTGDISTCTSETFYEASSGSISLSESYSLQKYDIIGIDRFFELCSWLNSAPSVEQGSSYAGIAYGANMDVVHVVAAEFTYKSE